LKGWQRAKEYYSARENTGGRDAMYLRDNNCSQLSGSRFSTRPVRFYPSEKLVGVNGLILVQTKESVGLKVIGSDRNTRKLFRKMDSEQLSAFLRTQEALIANIIKQQQDSLTA
jgi:hypothetical protein